LSPIDKKVKTKRCEIIAPLATLGGRFSVPATSTLSAAPDHKTRQE